MLSLSTKGTVQNTYKGLCFLWQRRSSPRNLVLYRSPNCFFRGPNQRIKNNNKFSHNRRGGESVYFDHIRNALLWHSICYLIIFFLKVIYQFNTKLLHSVHWWKLLKNLENAFALKYKVLITECIRNGTFFRRTRRIHCVPSLNTIVSLVLCKGKEMGRPCVEIPFSPSMTSIYLVIQSGELASNMQHSITIAAAKAMMFNRAV